MPDTLPHSVLQPAGKDIVIGAVTHQPTILNENLQRSEAVASGKLRLSVEHDAPSASIGYNRIIDTTTEPIIVFAHHDVYLPRGWESLLRRRIAELEAIDPHWAILAPFGISQSNVGYGPVWSTSLGCIVGRVALAPIPVQSVDELVIVMRRSPGLRFDETLPGFHFYGTDIVQMALAQGLGAYVMALPLIHNDGFKDKLDQAYVASYQHQRRKWRHCLPIHSPTVEISWHSLRLTRNRFRNLFTHQWRYGIAESAQTDPRKYAAFCGWSDLEAAIWPLP